MRFVLSIIALFMFLMPIGLQAKECGFEDGGYCVDQILGETQYILEQSSAKQPNTTPLTEEYGAATYGSSTYGISIYLRYEALWNSLVDGGLVKKQEKQYAFEEAANVGGTKIGGVNLVVLAARTLQKLVDLKIMNLEQAQHILNGARK